MKILILSLLVCLLLSFAAADISVFRSKRGPGFGRNGPPMRRPPPPPPPKFGRPGFGGPGKGGNGKTTVVIIKKG